MQPALALQVTPLMQIERQNYVQNEGATSLGMWVRRDWAQKVKAFPFKRKYN